MINRNLIFLLISDSIIIILSIIASAVFRFDFIVPDSHLSLITPFNIFFFLSTKLLIFNLFSLYRGMWRYTSVWDVWNIIRANILATIIIITYFYYTTSFVGVSRSIFIIDLIISIGFICTSRLGIRVFFSHIIEFITMDVKRPNKKKVLLIGAGDTGRIILQQTLKRTNNPIDVVGFLDDDSKKIGRELNGVPILCSIKKMLDIKIYYDEILICVPSATRAQMREIIDNCKLTGKPFKTLPSLGELIQGKISISQFREVSILDLLGRKEVDLDKKAINNFINGKRVLITGAGGSIGSELVRQCIKFNPSILIILDISELNLFKIEREINLKQSKVLVKPILSDIRDNLNIEQIFDEFKPQVVFHAAAYKHVPMQEKFPQEAIKTNVFGTKNVAEISVKNGVEKFVLVSTDKAVKPVNVMGATKRLAELVALNYNRNDSSTNFLAVRFGNVLGSSGSVIPIFKEQIKNGGPITVTDPRMERYFMSIPEASQLILQAASLGEGGEVFILDMGKPIKIVDLARELIKLSGYEPDLDIHIEFTGTRPGEKKIEELSLPSEHLDNTKHQKIFVLNDSEITDEFLSQVSSEIENMRGGIINKSANELRKLLSQVLREYRPAHASSEANLFEDGTKTLA